MNRVSIKNIPNNDHYINSFKRKKSLMKIINRKKKITYWKQFIKRLDKVEKKLIDKNNCSIGKNILNLS